MLHEGCRCDDCGDAQRNYQRDYRERKANGLPTVSQLPRSQNANPEPGLYSPGAVESGVEAEIAGLAEARPGLAQVALALARVMDSQKAVNQHPASAKVLATVLDKLRSTSAQNHRGNLALVRTMTEKGGDAGSESSNPRVR
jgi:hypothetical protein